MTEDEKAFGQDQWVYCKAHLKPHLTGWCKVGDYDKVGLGIKGQHNAQEAYEKCEEWGFNVR